MSGLPLMIWPEAEEDFREAAEWYEKQLKGLANDFAREVDIALQKVVLNPTLYAVKDKTLNIRGVWVARFPFKILYRVDDAKIEVCAIFHLKQDEWRLRRRMTSE